MVVVEEFGNGHSLVGVGPTTGLWRLKFIPATMSVEELYDTARSQGDGLGGFAIGLGSDPS